MDVMYFACDLIDIHGLSHVRTEKGGVKILWTLSTFLKVQKQNYDVSVMGRFTRNILQWNENDIKSSQTTNGDYSKG